ncbi:baseplate J/gp47 family protein [Micromonospora sp. LZ34]
MRPALPAHRARDHRALLDAMARDGRRRGRILPRPWDPVRSAAQPDSPDLADHGRGLLDALAVGLHVLWVYQEAWADEGFLATARIPASVRRLLELVGYAGDPGFAAAGLQHFRCREGATTTLPPGFRVRADAGGGQPAAVFETIRAIRLWPQLNELRPFLPLGPPSPPTTGAVAYAVELLQPEVSVPPPEVAGAVALTDELGDRFAAARAGNLAQRNAVRARQKALALADVVSQLKAAGGPEACPDLFEQLCDDLCQAQSLANEAGYDPLPGPLSESQELLLSLMRGMSTRQPAAVQALQDALARQPGEADAAWSGRLDRIATFLDALVTALLQEARDQVVRLHGPRALEAADRAVSGASPVASFTLPSRRGGRGVAAPGTDALYFDAAAELLRPGDWLVVAEDVPVPDGTEATAREYREAVQVVRLRREVPAGDTETAVRVTFTPPLVRRYRLDRTVLLGNVAEITHGTTTSDHPVWAGDQVHLDLAAGPLTWLRSASPDATDGRLPQVSLEVAGRAWERAGDLRGRAGTATFAVEVAPDATSRLRLAEGGAAPALADGTPVTITYRTGTGVAGNRPALAVKALASADPAVAETFNPLPVTGGVDPEDADTSRNRARAGTHALQRAVSADDLRALALAFGGVRQAAVLRDAVRRRDHLTVVVSGEGGAALADADAARLRAFLLARTPPGTAVTVVARGVVPVRMRVVVRVEPGRDPLAVVREVRLRLGADSEDGAAPGLLQPDVAQLGRPVHASDAYRALDGVPYLASVLVDLLYREGTPPARHDVVAVGPAELALWAADQPLDVVWEEARDL